MVAGVEGDPIFPQGGLSIAPSHSSYSDNGYKDQETDIQEYGIAGRTWEATYLLTQYLTKPVDGALLFDPPCSLFDATHNQQRFIIELGAGVGVVGIQLGLELANASFSTTTAAAAHTVVLTDLEAVLPLLQRNVKQANLQNHDNISTIVRSLPWGSKKEADSILKEMSPKRLSHIICSDLIYFPELLSPLLRSLIHLTNTSNSSEIEVIIGYKLRSHSKEEPFWKGFGVWFEFVPVLCKKPTKDGDWRRFGSKLCDSGRTGLEKYNDTPAEDEMFVFSAHRKKTTLDCTSPADDDQLLGGWMVQDGLLKRGNGAETFEVLLMNAIQD